MTTNNNFRVKNGLEVATTATVASVVFSGDNSVQTSAATAIPVITAAATTATSTATGKLVSISNTGGKLAYYSSTASQWRYVGTEAVVYTPPDPNAPPVSDYIAWYDASSINLGTATWTDKSGNGYHGSIGGSPTIVSTSSNGATETFNVLSGGTSDLVTFPAAIVPSTYTLFHVTRYSGSNRGRMLNQPFAGDPYWISGFYNGIAGFAYSGGTVNPDYVDYGNNWVISAHQNYFYRPNGNTARDGTSGSGGYASGMKLNGYVYEANQLCDFQCAEIIVYNRTLTSGEIATMEAFLGTKYGITIG